MSATDTGARNRKIGARIRKRRQALGLDQRELAAEVGVHVNSVQKWEAGTHYPGRKLGRLEQVLGIQLDEEPEPGIPRYMLDWVEHNVPREGQAEVIAAMRAALDTGAHPAVPDREGEPGEAAGGSPSGRSASGRRAG